MIQTINIEMHFTNKTLFKNVNLKFLPNNNYGVIGANGAGKSTFLKILSGQEEASSGSVIVEKGKRISVLDQDQRKYANESIINVVIGGHHELYEIIQKKEALYAKEDFTEEDGTLAAELEDHFATLGGWEAESNAEQLLTSLGLTKKEWSMKLKDVNYSAIVKVLLARALFGNPDILIMDEPTNHLDLRAINWLEEFLKDYENTLIIVSHDTEFLDRVCTHIVDIDFQEAKLFPGNYSFWKESSELLLELSKRVNVKKEQQIKELEEFIARFSANAARSKQATSRRKSLEKIELDEIKPSTRKYPYINFAICREPGKQILVVENLSYKNDHGVTLFENVSFRLNTNEKMVLFGKDDIAKTRLLQILAGEIKPTSGIVEWGSTITPDYIPLDNKKYFTDGKNLLDWISQWTPDNEDLKMRSFLGRMLFGNDTVFQNSSSTSGGEKVRLMFARAMVRVSNFLIFDQPLEHLDVESIEAFIKGINDYRSSVIFTTYNQKLINTANVILEIGKKGSIIYRGLPDDYITSEEIKAKVDALD